MNRKIAATALPLLVVGLLSGCQKGAQEAKDDGAEEVVATVNDATITQRELDAYIAHQQSARPDDPPDRHAALDELVQLEVIEQQAEEEGLDERDDVKAELEWQRTNLLVNAFMREHMDNMSFSEEELKAEYEAQVAQLSDREYKARHILMETRKEAGTIISRLNKGADFVSLSAEESSAPSALEGGDLGWFSPDTMVAPFAEAVRKLEKGAYTKEPVKTQFGWHVILLEDTRKLEPPPFEDVRERVESILTSNALQSYIEKLREGAEIEIKLKPQAQTPKS